MGDLLKFNAITGQLDLISDEVTQASRVVLTFDCLASVSVKDVVYQDSVTDTFVNESVNNTETQPSIGTVISKPTTTTCNVLILGLEDGYSGLTIGAKVFLGASGGTASSFPASGYIQTLGIAVSATQIYFQPNTTRVLQV